MALQQLIQTKFRGLYDRGVTDSVPPDFFQDCLNVKYGQNEVSTRDGSVVNIVTPGIVRFHVYKRLNETPRFIWLDNNGALYDSLYSSPIFPADPLFVDFSMVNYENRAYITPHNRVSGIPGRALIVYEGGGAARLAAGTTPIGFSLGAANSSTSGSIEIGYHWFAVSFITGSGFVTPPGPVVLTSVLAPGAHKMDISAIPLGPSGTVARVILSTKAIDEDVYSGYQFQNEFFFIPGGTIQNNTATTATVDFFDSELVSSADYLFDNLETIQAGLGLVVYDNRLGIWNSNGEQHTIRLSKQFDPETFSEFGSALTVDPSDASSGIKNAAVFRGSLILLKSNRTYSSTGTNDDPNTWAAPAVDLSSGTECFGVNTVLDARGNNNDRLFIATKPGLISFEGYIKKPELSYNIEDIWKRINPAYFNLVQVIDDPVNHRVLITVPLDNSTVISHILYADYSQSFTVYGTINEQEWKWAIWTLPDNVNSIAGDSDSVTNLPVIHIAVDNGAIVDIQKGLTNDYDIAFPSNIKTALRTFKSGWYNQFSSFQLRIVGNGILNIFTSGEDNVHVTQWRPIDMTLAPGQEFARLINFKNEKCAFRFSTTLINHRFTISTIQITGSELWQERPAAASLGR